MKWVLKISMILRSRGILTLRTEKGVKKGNEKKKESKKRDKNRDKEF